MILERLLPESLPRQKAYIYIFLVALTSLFIYFYSYPLSTENWTYIREKIVYGANFKTGEQFKVSDANEYDSAFGENGKSTDSIILKSLVLDVTENIGDKDDKQSASKEVTSNDEKLSQGYTSAVTLETAQKSSTESENFDGKENGEARIAKAKINEQQNDLATDGVHVTNDQLSVKTSKINEEQNDLAITADGLQVSDEQLSVKTSPEIQTDEKTDANITPTAKEQVEISTESTERVTKTTHPVDHTSSPQDKDIEILITTKLVDSRTILNKVINDEITVPEISTSSRSTPKPILADTSTEESVTHSFDSTAINTTSSSFEKGYLVYSEQCRIPDIDPMDSSIAHLISKTPPLDCSENYKPLTRTEGHVLFLNESAVLERTAGDNYTCCYKSVFREDEGMSDNRVGFGKECVPISHGTTIKDEFIAVECAYQNGTNFYEELHSFIFDKPKVEKRCGRGKDSQYSVLIIGADAVSRLNMHRQLNATAEYLLKNMDAIEMYGFNKVGDNTFPNLVPLLLGYDERELSSVCWKSKDLPLDRCNFLWKKFAKKGYRTFYAEDSPYISSFNYAKKGFYLQPTDYYFRPFILAYEDALGRNKPLNCYLCVGSTSETEAVLHWAEQFASHFATRPYFAFSWINSATHDFLNMGSSVDHMYERFFRTLHETGALSKTVVILMGDHGMRWGSIRHTYVGRMEERLPMLIISLPQQFKSDYPQLADSLRVNSRRLVTPFDLHATLLHLLDLRSNWSLTNIEGIPEELKGNFTRRALSLFRPIPEDRSCDDAFIQEHWCTCESSLEIDTQRNDVKRVAKFLLNRVNNLLNPVSDKCALLKLDSISEARIWQPPAEHKGHSADERIYTVVIQTSPGKAVFEGTVKISRLKTGNELLGTISRLNLYGNQSSCINNAILKKYCYCL